jgi:hypothetical protein
MTCWTAARAPTRRAYDGSIGSFRVERFADGYRVVDRTLSEGSDLLTGIERPMLRYLTIPVTPFQQNCSLVWCDSHAQAAVIDPGGDLDRAAGRGRRLGLTLEQIWLTHAHIDHAGGTAELAQRCSLPIIGPHPATSSGSTASAAAKRDVRLSAREALHAHALAARWRHGADGQRAHAERAPLPRPHAGPCGVPLPRDRSAPLWATCCLPAASAAPISRRATMPAADRQHHAAPVAHGRRHGVHPRPRAGEHLRRASAAATPMCPGP